MVFTLHHTENREAGRISCIRYEISKTSPLLPSEADRLRGSSVAMKPLASPHTPTSRSRKVQSDEFCPDALRYGLGARPDVELAIDAAKVGVHGVFAEVKPFANAGFRVPSGKFPEHFALTAGERFFEWFRFSEMAQNMARDRR